MKIEVIRKWFTERSSCGIWLFDGELFCKTLENVARADGVKIYGQTCIPPGGYSVTMEDSPHFGRTLPKLHKVPMFTEILVHRLNYPEETLGCIGVGFNMARDVIWRSKDAEIGICAKITGAIGRGELIYMEVSNKPV